jgi:hypothetical protein
MFILSTYDLVHDGAETSRKEFYQLADAVKEYRHLLSLGKDTPMLYCSTGEIIYGLGEEVEGL